MSLKLDSLDRDDGFWYSEFYEDIKKRAYFLKNRYGMYFYFPKGYSYTAETVLFTFDELKIHNNIYKPTYSLTILSNSDELRYIDFRISNEEETVYFRHSFGPLSTSAVAFVSFFFTLNINNIPGPDNPNGI